MTNFNFRLLTPQDIEVRTAFVKNNYATLLLYKDARTDMDILDDTVGPTKWKNHYECFKNTIYCTISIFDNERNEWISKSDCGEESNISAAKGESSDAFKRAAFRWGIGRELYSTPRINIRLASNENQYTKFFVKEIKFENKKCTFLTIEDANGNIRFEWAQNRASTGITEYMTTDYMVEPEIVPQRASITPNSTEKMTVEKLREKVIEAQHTGKYKDTRLKEFYKFYTSPDKYDNSKMKFETFRNFDFDEKLAKWPNVLK